MLKRIIFDVDNTLIQWKDEYYKKINKPFEELKISYIKEDLLNVVKAIDNYEKKYEYFNIYSLQEMFCHTLNKKLPENFTNIVLKYFKTCVPDKLPQKEIDTLTYLQQKYDLVVLTNWFKDVQIERLKKVGIYDCFKEIYATEKIKMKPNPESFQTAMGEQKPEECVMVGDNLKQDIQGALNCGIPAIYITLDKKANENKLYKTIHDLTELKKIL